MAHMCTFTESASFQDELARLQGAPRQFNGRPEQCQYETAGIRIP